MKTFQELIDNQSYVFPEYVDEATQKLLTAKFSIRKCPKNFERLFNLDLDVYWEQYIELLRVDPRNVKIDWMVQNYLERQLFEQSSENTEGVKNSNGAVNRQIHGTKYNVNNKSGTEGGYTLNTKNLKDRRDYEDHNENENNMNSVNEGASDANSRQFGFARVNPMSQSYSSNDMTEIYKSKGQTLRAGGKLSNGGKTYGIPYPDIKNPSSSTDGLTMNADVRYDTGESASNGKNDAHGYDELNKTGTDRNDRALTNSELNILTGNEDGSINSQNEGHEQSLGSSEGSSLYQDIQTGRNVLPSEALEKAVKYISGTNAFKWLTKTLDCNFLLVYDKEDYYEYD